MGKYVLELKTIFCWTPCTGPFAAHRRRRGGQPEPSQRRKTNSGGGGGEARSTATQIRFLSVRPAGHWSVGLSVR